MAVSPVPCLITRAECAPRGSASLVGSGAWQPVWVAGRATHGLQIEPLPFRPTRARHDASQTPISPSPRLFLTRVSASYPSPPPARHGHHRRHVCPCRNQEMGARLSCRTWQRSSCPGDQGPAHHRYVASDHILSPRSPGSQRPSTNSTRHSPRLLHLALPPNPLARLPPRLLSDHSSLPPQ